MPKSLFLTANADTACTLGDPTTWLFDRAAEVTFKSLALCVDRGRNDHGR
jgi:hypothetical protein